MRCLSWVIRPACVAAVVVGSSRAPAAKVCTRAGRRSRRDLDNHSQSHPRPGRLRFPGLFVFMSDLLPLFLNVTGRPVALVGGGRVAAGKLQQLLAAGARVTVVAPAMSDGIRSQAANVVALRERPFAPSDLDGVW